MADSFGLTRMGSMNQTKESEMNYHDDDELFSIGAVALVEESGEVDTTSDASDWVMQYMAWEDAPAFRVAEFVTLSDAKSQQKNHPPKLAPLM